MKSRDEAVEGLEEDLESQLGVSKDGVCWGKIRECIPPMVAR